MVARLGASFRYGSLCWRAAMVLVAAATAGRVGVLRRMIDALFALRAVVRAVVLVARLVGLVLLEREWELPPLSRS